MANYPDVDVGNLDWVNLHTTVGLAAGVGIQMQNAGTNYVRVVEASVKPAVAYDVGDIIQPGTKGDDKWTSVPAATEFTWAICTAVQGSKISVSTL